VRRFFPFGANGGGLTPDEQAAYQVALAQVAGVAHPALRAVVAGGCDPVDGMPFVVTEWVAGHALAEVLKPGKLKPSQAALLLVSALEVSALLSQTLEHEAVWVDTRLSSIVIGDETSGRRATFWISTSRWLDGGASVGSLQGILQLAEDLLGWCGRLPNNRARAGLVQWIRWLRAHVKAASLAEARTRLEDFLDSMEPPPAGSDMALGDGQLQPESTATMRSRYLPQLFAGVATVALIGAAGWWISQRARPLTSVVRPATTAAGTVPCLTAGSGYLVPSHGVAVPAAGAAPGTDRHVAAAAARGTAMADGVADQLDRHKSLPAPERQPQAGGGDGMLPVFAPAQTAELMAARNREVIVEGVLVEVIAARSGSHLYLEFSKPGPPYLTRGILYVEHGAQMDVKSALDSWVGKRVRIVGRVDIERFRDGKLSVARPKIPLRGRDEVELME